MIMMTTGSLVRVSISYFCLKRIRYFRVRQCILRVLLVETSSFYDAVFQCMKCWMQCSKKLLEIFGMLLMCTFLEKSSHLSWV